MVINAVPAHFNHAQARFQRVASSNSVSGVWPSLGRVSVSAGTISSAIDRVRGVKMIDLDPDGQS